MCQCKPRFKPQEFSDGTGRPWCVGESRPRGRLLNVYIRSEVPWEARLGVWHRWGRTKGAPARTSFSRTKKALPTNKNLPPFSLASRRRASSLHNSFILLFSTRPLFSSPHRSRVFGREEVNTKLETGQVRGKEILRIL